MATGVPGACRCCGVACGFGGTVSGVCCARRWVLLDVRGDRAVGLIRRGLGAATAGWAGLAARVGVPFSGAWALSGTAEAVWVRVSGGSGATAEAPWRRSLGLFRPAGRSASAPGVRAAPAAPGADAVEGAVGAGETGGEACLVSAVGVLGAGEWVWAAFHRMVAAKPPTNRAAPTRKPGRP